MRGILNHDTWSKPLPLRETNTMATEPDRKILVSITTTKTKMLIHPKCRTAWLFARLGRKKTFTTNDISLIRELGFEVSVSPSLLAE